MMRVLHATGAVLLLVTPVAAQTVGPLLLHITALLAIIMHWVAGHHFCILSYAEIKLRGIPFEEGALTRLFKPFFTFSCGRPWAWVLGLGLLALSIRRVVRLSRPHKYVPTSVNAAAAQRRQEEQGQGQGQEGRCAR
jgi:hypothetical protein